jgi:hypothetical protein
MLILSAAVVALFTLSVWADIQQSVVQQRIEELLGAPTHRHVGRVGRVDIGGLPRADPPNSLNGPERTRDAPDRHGLSF